MCALLVFIVAPEYFDTCSVASNLKQELQDKQRLVKDEVTMCVGSNSKLI